MGSKNTSMDNFKIKTPLIENIKIVTYPLKLVLIS